jgi:hypothetical protein
VESCIGAGEEVLEDMHKTGLISLDYKANGINENSCTSRNAHMEVDLPFISF